MKLQNPDDPVELAEALEKRKSGLHWERLPVLAPRPKVIIDVGAGGGVKSFYRAFPKAKFYLIDALEENRERLQRKREEFDVEVIIGAAGAKAGTLKMHVPAGRKTGKSSFLERSGAFSEFETASRDVEVRPLDDLVPPLKVPLGLKIDAEGFEREVLLGARRILRQCNWVVCEVSMAPRFHDDPLFAGVYPLLEKAGFAFRDFVDLTRQGGGDLRRIDAVFVKRKYVNYPRERRERRQKLRNTTIGKIVQRLMPSVPRILRG